MRQLASGICLVTQNVNGVRAGMTATAVASLSLDPPTLIVCVNRAASIYAGLTPGAAFGVSVLGADHREFADRFAGRTGENGAERFREGRWRIAPNGAPLLGDALAAFACEVEEIVERNTHAIVIGRVKHAAAASGGGALLYWRGVYDQVGWSDDELARATGRSSQSEGR
jgi:flavin reductase (DIM6/NTAB) family NADH-FMN oxidoreductase RutF